MRRSRRLAVSTICSGSSFLNMARKRTPNVAADSVGLWRFGPRGGTAPGARFALTRPFCHWQRPSASFTLRGKMAERIQTAGVIGAGVMGSAIAAHFAGAGIRTHLLDIVPPNLKPEEATNPKARNRFADGGLEKALKAKPAAFFTPDAARLVTTGNLEDHLERLKECDLIVEAVVEDLEIKRKLFEKIAPYVRPNAILASNTSGLSIASMSEVLPQELKSRFLVLHFFNPVRYMRLLEVAKAPETDPAVMQRMTEFGEFLGKGVIDAKDTPNFVANRIGVYSMMLTMHQMLEAGLSLEAVDKITGKPMGRPSSAAFGTGDLVGIDTLVHVAKNCFDSLTRDEARSTFEVPEFVRDLLAAGRLGRKTSAGFYKKTPSELLVYDVEEQGLSQPRKGALRLARRDQERRRSEEALAEAGQRGGRRGQVRLGGALAHARVQRASLGRDRRRHREHRSSHALGLQLGSGSVRGLGRDRRSGVRRAHEARGARGSRVGREHARFRPHELLRGRPRGADVLRRRSEDGASDRQRRQADQPARAEERPQAAGQKEPRRVARRSGRRRAVRRVPHQAEHARQRRDRDAGGSRRASPSRIFKRSSSAIPASTSVPART